MQRTSTNARLFALLAVIVIFAGGITYTLIELRDQATELVRQQEELVRQNDEACVDRVHQWTALHDTIVEQTKVQPANPIIIKAFPQFAPFYTPGTPQFAEAARIADDKRDRALGKLGDRPTC